jgi:hypothetical protein
MVLQMKTKYINYPTPFFRLFFYQPEFMFVASIHKGVPKFVGGEFGNCSV